ncbi:VWA domain-containing protein [Rheinheimera maricola]|uniref:VWA domain-containing protein n=1 Tax=Rheinheimera maricola TaxID=2793282 RepID=A0ABS7X9C3_9GAMM|nr:VWA domain-containing protein [Rheinheimera maricola]MBZ9611700.1 VWA domain-containing protein [Rheinheimera maricola]
MLADLHFLRPWWLLAALPVLLLALLLYFHRREQSPWHSLIAAHLQPILLGGQLLVKKQPLALPLLLLCWLVTTVALAGPSWQKLPQPAFALKKATVLVLDMSMSMRANDMAPDRLTQQRFAALDFAAQLKEGELALVSFAGDAFVISPLTPDHNNIALLIPDLKPEIMPVQGSNLLSALQQADKLLRQAGYLRGDVVVFTDGFDSNSYRDIQDLLNSWPHRLSVLGFGTADGAPIKLENNELLKDARGAVVLAKLPQAQLATLAKRSGGVYQQADSSGRALQALLNIPALSALDQADSTTQIQGDQWQDNAIYLIWLLLPLILLQRKYSSLLAITAVMLLPRPAEAFEWRDLWQTQQQQAQQDYANGNYADAKRKFNDPLWQGNAAYRNGDFQAAEQAYRLATTQSTDAAAWHNLGNSLAQQQRYEEALAAYQQALELNSADAAAQHNANLMQQLLQQQEQQKQDQQQKGQQPKEGEQQKGEDGEQQDSEQPSQSDENNDSDDNEDGQAPQQNESQDAQQDTEAETEQQAEMQPMPQQETDNEAEQQQQIQAVQEAWPNATEEEQQQLDNLLRKVQDDPALLLRNKMYLEYLKRQQQRLPKGVDEQW